MNFPGKKALSVFKYSNYLTLCKKSEKTNDPFLRKMPDRQTDRQTDRQADGQTDRQTDRQTDNSDFIRLPVGQGSNKKTRTRMSKICVQQHQKQYH